MSRPLIVAKPEGGRYFDFDSATWNPDEEEGSQEWGVRVALTECTQLVVDEYEGLKAAEEAYRSQLLSKVVCEGAAAT